jgi:hypothetical protein
MRWPMSNPASFPPGVFAVQCPNPKCKRYMLVEEHDRGKVVPCLICKTNIKVGAPKAKGEGAK